MRAVAPHAGQRPGHRADRLARRRQVDGDRPRWYGRSGRPGSGSAVLAVDPTSPFSGGALLGDRVRMSDHATDPGVFIRSMASRGHLGGLSAAAPQALRVLDAAGFDVICVETVGVGQAEVEIAGLADTTLVVMAPGLGDSIQTAKAGILEIADIFVVNKSDRPGAHEVVGTCGPCSRWRRYGERLEAADRVGVGGDRRGHRRAGRPGWTRTGPGWADSASGSERRLARAARGDLGDRGRRDPAPARRRCRGSRGSTSWRRRSPSGKLDPYSAADELTGV